MLKSFVTPISNAVLPPSILALEREYMFRAPDQDFEISLSAVQHVTVDGLSTKLCSPGIFLDSIWFYANKTPDGGNLMIHRRIIREPLPYGMLASAGANPVPCEVLGVLVWGIDLGNKSVNYPLSKAQNSHNHVLCPLSKEVVGVCTLTPLPSGKLSCSSPLNQRPKSFAPGSVLVFTTQGQSA
jgi:hypothetical protein